MPEIVQKFIIGTRVKVFRNAIENPVDEGVIESIENGSVAGSTQQMEVRSLRLYPNVVKKYGLFHYGWRRIFTDAATGNPYHSGENSAVFRFELA